MGTGTPIARKRRVRDASQSVSRNVTYVPILDDAITATREIGSIGSRFTSNRLYAANNLGVLKSLCDDKSVIGQVRLVYIDPPYATGFAFESATVGTAYHDEQIGTDYLNALRERIIVLRELLAEDGSIYLHLDSTMIFQAKLLMDEIFGEKRFINLITRVKCNPKNQVRRGYGDVCDYLLFYSKGRDYVWNQPTIPWDETAGAKEYNCVEASTGRRYKKVPCHLPGIRNGETGLPWRGKLPPPGKHWVHSPSKLGRLVYNVGIWSFDHMSPDICQKRILLTTSNYE